MLRPRAGIGERRAPQASRPRSSAGPNRPNHSCPIPSTSQHVCVHNGLIRLRICPWATKAEPIGLFRVREYANQRIAALQDMLPLSCDGRKGMSGEDQLALETACQTGKTNFRNWNRHIVANY